MNDKKPETKKVRAEADGATSDPVHTVRQGAVAASVWMRQSPSGYAYLDFSLSRSWKSMSTEKAGYSRNFFARNKAELISVIEQASAWIEAEERKLSDQVEKTAQAA